MRSSPCLLALSFVALLSSALTAQAHEEQHLLRLALEPGATQHYRKTLVNTIKLGDQAPRCSTLEITLECKVLSVHEGKADLEQTMRRLVTKAGTEGAEAKVQYDSEQGGNGMGLFALVGEPVRMKLDDRGQLSEFQLPDAMKGAASPKAFFVHCITLPETPVAVGKTWQTIGIMPIPELGDREVKMVHKLAAVAAGRATIESAVELDAEQVKLRNGGKFEKYVATTVLELASGKLVDARSECCWSVAQGTDKRVFRMTEKIEPIAPPPKQGATPADAKSGDKD